MKRKGNEGFTLLETLIAIVILGIVVVPTCSSLVMSFRMNAKADELLRDQLAVSSAVETLMAEGIYTYADTYTDYWGSTEGDRFPEVQIDAKKDGENPWYTVTVSKGEVTVETVIREAEPPVEPTPSEGEGM